MRRLIIICFLLAGITLATYWPVGQLGFIIYDDHAYVLENPEVQAGLTPKSISWAFSTSHVGNWHPLTWVSHILDCQLFGLNASGPHWMNLGLHIANTLLLFLGLRQMTGTVWRSSLVAALFALHPLHIQSVAWISERKDLLSGLFFLLTLLLYTHYCRKKSFIWYATALIVFAVGLMAKPMLVTLPIILLLLDVWPLNRWQPVPNGGPSQPANPQANLKYRWFLIVEKLPFLALCLASSIVTMWAQHKAEFMVSTHLLPWPIRAFNALVFYTDYLGKTLWPENLSIFYPYARMHLWEYVCYALLPIGVSVFCLLRFRSQPFLWVGWFWFLVMLVPVIGIVQVGMQSIADRYTYLPSIGLFIMVAWGMASIAALSNRWRAGVIIGATAILLASIADTRIQLKYWQNSITLFSRSVEITKDNNLQGYFLLGNSFWESGNLTEAARSYRAALQIAPDYADARRNLIAILLAQNQYAEAKTESLILLQLQPDTLDVLNNLAWLLATCPEAKVRDGEQAVQLAERACALTHHEQAVFIGTLAAAYAEAERFDEAIATANTACVLARKNNQPDFLQKNQDLIRLFQAQKPYRDVSQR